MSRSSESRNENDLGADLARQRRQMKRSVIEINKAVEQQFLSAGASARAISSDARGVTNKNLYSEINEDISNQYYRDRYKNIDSSESSASEIHEEIKQTELR